MSTRKSAHHSPTLESETVLVLQGGHFSLLW